MNVFSMKKYLMTGMAAVVFGGLFTSCSHDIEGGGSEQEQVQKTYRDAFITRFGQPAADLDWGFGSSTKASTRAENKNLNEWGDPTKGNWIVPDALTDGQKIRVMAYFQANPGLTYQDPKLKNFFIQQVYKGGTTPGAISSEQYTQTNGTPLIGSNNMDWLYMGEGYDHVNDYNNGQWNNGTPYEVLNTGADANKHQGNTTHVEGVTHPDMITLMENSSTEFVAFGSSTGNQYHTDCCALAGWKVIEDWAIAHQDSLKAIKKYGESLNDGWNRSFVGLDYENRTVEGLYITPKTNAKALDNNFIDGNSHWVLYQGTVYSFDDFRNTIGNFDFRDVNGNLVYYVTDNVSNQAIADYIKYTKSDGTIGNVTKDAYNYKLSQQQFKDIYGVDITNGEDQLYDLDKIQGYILQSALPTQNNGNWVKNIGGRDYVFSDWIVTLTEAKKQGDNPTDVWEAVRVIAEDLTVDSDAEGNSDFDFNDIVFDVRRCTSGPSVGTVQVILKAAGGTLPLYIDGQEVHQLYAEANPTLDIDQYTMINTHAERNGRKGKSGLADIVFTPSDYTSGNTTYDIGYIANSISIYVIKGGVPCYLSAPHGDVASKVCVGTDFDWCDERQDIDDKYSLDDGTSLFKEYVKGALGNRWYYTFTEKQ